MVINNAASKNAFCQAHENLYMALSLGPRWSGKKSVRYIHQRWIQWNESNIYLWFLTSIVWIIMFPCPAANRKGCIYYIMQGKKHNSEVSHVCKPLNPVSSSNCMTSNTSHEQQGHTNTVDDIPEANPSFWAPLE